MKGTNLTEENDLRIAKEFLDNMLAGLEKEERNRILKMLLDLTEKNDAIYYNF